LTEEDQRRLANLGNNPPRQPSGKIMTGSVHIMRLADLANTDGANTDGQGSATPSGNGSTTATTDIRETAPQA
ncbi:MAG: hypothetical protein ACR2G7_00425, partial [Acidimicrobiales bacterium]